MNNFVHLHLHTEFSLLDGFTRIDSLFKKADKLKMKAVAITDHGSMFGVVDFYKEALKHDIKPIIGCEVYVAKQSRFDKNPQYKDSGHLVLLVKNAKGYQNLIKLVSESYINGFYYKPRIDYDLLQKHSEGLIALSACLAGHVQQALLYDNVQEAKRIALKLKDIMKSGNFYLELQDHNIPEQKKVNNHLMNLSKELDIPLVATNDVHYLDKDDSDYHDVLLCIQTGKVLEDKKRMKFPTDEFYFKSYEEMNQLFPYALDALKNTEVIADMCDFEFDFETMHLPEFIIESEEGAKNYLKRLCLDGLSKKYGEVTSELYERLTFELDTINQMGYNDYFLITWDFIKYAKTNGIFVGPGRGSAGGSLVAYALDITDVDPMKFDLIFERFLNPERVSMPDIDIDFQDDRRQEVIDYVIHKYGKDKVAQIITFGTMAAKGAIRDVGRVMDLPYGYVDKVAKSIPFGKNIDQALASSEKFKEFYKEDNRARKLINISKKLEGVPRHCSTHAAGVVVAKKSVDNYVPLYVHDGSISTQYNMTLLEELGLLKIDFLGLRTLTVLKNTLDLIPDNLKLSDIPFDDSKTFDMISSGNTLGVFQLESAGMISFMKSLKPDNIEDIIAGISLYRPGPMDSIPTYIANKNNPDKIKYLHPMLEDILDVTYGCLVYQEQVMQIVRKLAGYSYGRSDLVRRAMSKKKMDVMEKERQNFIYGIEEKGEVILKGCVRNGISADIANEIYDDMIDFGKYAFNKSHAAGYSIIAYQTAYLKAHYPVEFLAATMSSVMGTQGKIAKYISESQRMGIEVLPPNVNKSFDKFTVEDGNIRFGLLAIKNVGRGIIASITKYRKKALFSSSYDLCERIDSSELNKKAIESLIKSGAFDCFGNYRSQELAIFEKMIDSIQKENRQVTKGQISLFKDFETQVPDSMSFNTVPDIPEMNKKHLLDFEKEMLGLYLTAHPLDDYKEALRSNFKYNLQYIKSETKLDQEWVTCGGMIRKVIKKITKRNNQMAFIVLEDLVDEIEVILFPRTYEKVKHLIKEDKIIGVNGKVDIQNDEPKIIANKVKVIELKKDIKKEKKLYIKLAEKDDVIIKRLKIILKKYKGKTKVCLYIEKNKKMMIASEDLWVTINNNLIFDLKEFLGDENIKYC